MGLVDHRKPQPSSELASSMQVVSFFLPPSQVSEVQLRGGINAWLVPAIRVTEVSCPIQNAPPQFRTVTLVDWGGIQRRLRCNVP